MKTLTDLNVGASAKVLGFHPGAKAYRQKLLAMGITPGVHVQILRKAPLGDPIELQVRGYSLSLRKKECQCIAISE